VSSSPPNPVHASCSLDDVHTKNVRQLVRDLLAGHAGLIVDDAVLVTDELVTNAHRHGEAPRTCRLSLIDHGRCLRIEVDDTSSREPRIRTPDHTGGRGLILVDRLASRWGFDHTDTHKTVWAELDLDTPGSSGHAPHLTAARSWST
jgi:anti-sigma regulatory factor (Ser/Thr protein kinase)